MARSYRLGKRAEVVARSRERIIDAARTLLAAPDYSGLSVESVADAAGVSRPTVYNQFESKRGIIQAVFEDIGRRIRFERVHEALCDPDPRSALERSVAEHCRAWARDARVIRRVLALTTVDPDLAALVEHFESMRRASYAKLVLRLCEGGGLHPGFSTKEVTKTLGVLTSFWTYDQFVAAGLSRESIARTLTELARAVLFERARR